MTEETFFLDGLPATHNSEKWFLTVLPDGALRDKLRIIVELQNEVPLQWIGLVGRVPGVDC